MDLLARRAILAVTAAILFVGLTACGNADARRARYMQRGQAYLAQGNLPKAQIEFRNALQIAPTDLQAHLMAGRVAERLGDLRTAAGLYQSALELDATDAEAAAKLGRLYALANDPDRALQVIAAALLRHPDNADLLCVRAAARAEQHDRAGALSDAEKAVALAPLNDSAVALLASLHQQAGDIPRAIELVRATLERLPA